MTPRWEESEFIFCDLQGIARYIRVRNPRAARRFLVAVYDTFEFLAAIRAWAAAGPIWGFPRCVRGVCAAFLDT